MEKERKIKILILVALVIVVLGLTIAFAALSQSLKISGFEQINGLEGGMLVCFVPTNRTSDFSSDDCYKSSATYLVVNQDGESDLKSIQFEQENPSYSGSYGNKIYNYSVTLEKPGDYVDLIFAAGAYSSYDAIFKEYKFGTPTCSSTVGNSDDEKLICDNLKLELFEYKEPYSQELPAVTTNDIITARSSRRYVLRVGLDKNMNSLPTADVNVNNINLDLIFTQR